MKKCSNHRPDFKELEFKENPSRKNIFDLQPSSSNFNKFNYFRLEEPQKPYLLQRGVKYVCECWDKDIKTLHTGLIPIGERTGERTGEPCYYFGDHIETVRNKTKSSLMIFRLCPGSETIKIYYFNHFNKRSILMKLLFCRNFVDEIKKGTITTPPPNVQITSRLAKVRIMNKQKYKKKMIDGILILRLAVIIDELLKNNLLLFPLPIDKNGGEILDRTRTCEHQGLIFVLKNNNVKLKGSLHKYHNNGVHNYNDYFFTDLQQTIFELSENFKINPDRSLLNNLEFGVNIQTKYAFEEISRSIVNYKGAPFHPFTIAGAKGIECETDNFYIKIYDKGHQYNQPGNLLRFEIKVRKMKFFQDRGIKITSLSSLLDYSEIIKLKRVITGIFDEILFTDYNIPQNRLTPANRLILSQGSNAKYWEQLKPKSKEFGGGNKNKEYISKRKKYYRELDNFKKLICKFSSSTMQKDISLLIEKKCNELLKTVDKFPDCKMTSKNDDSGQIHISNIVGYCPTTAKDTRVCLTCGNDISHKRKIAKFCSKKCKNDYTNPKLNPKNNLLRRLYKIQTGGLLFDISEFIVLSAQQRELLNNINSIRNYERI